MTPEEAAAARAQAELDHGDNIKHFPGRKAGNGQADNTADPPPRTPLRPKSMAALAGKPVPPFQYDVDGWIPTGKPVLASGKGGSGKTTLFCQFGAARAAGQAFLGLETRPGKTFALLCEDEEDDTHRMLARYVDHYGKPWSDFSDFHYLSTLGQDNVLVARTSRGGIQPTAFYELYREMLADLKVDVNLIDNAGHVALINENDRSEVTTAWSLLHGLMRPVKGTTILLGHVPKNGSAEFAGSAAWENVARCRTFLGPAGADPDADPVDNDPRRILRRGKSNSDGTGSLDLVFDRGVFRLENPDCATYGDQLGKEMRKGQAGQAFLDALDTLTGQQRSTSHADCARNFAPKVIKAAGLAGDFTVKELTAAMYALFNEHRIKAAMPLPFRDQYRRPLSGIARC